MNKIKKYIAAIFLSGVSVVLLAQSNEAPRLIVRGDDMGFAQSANEAILKASLDGIQTCIEIMPNTPWFSQAVAMLKQHPKIDVGIHLTLTSEWDNLKWRPLTPAPSLIDANGYFYPFLWPNQDYPGQHLREKPWKLDEVEKEFRAQIEKVLKDLPWASHLSAHMGCTALDPKVADLVNQLAKEYKLLFDLKTMGVEGVSYKGPKRTSIEKKTAFLATLKELKPGKTYLFVDHPAFDTPEIKAVHHIGYTDVAEDRQGVTDTWTDPEVKATIRSLGIKLISYKELEN